MLEDGVPKPVISGGEEDLANLVLRLAISQMIAERAGQNFSLLILDEVFGSLDEARRHNVVELLRGLQDRFEQVILITHIEPVREGLDRVISVRYDEESGLSVVTQSDERGRELPAPDRASATRRLRSSARRRRTDGDRPRLEAAARTIDGPHRVRSSRRSPRSIGVFSDAFTERYRRDGMVGVRVPHLNPAVWRYAIEDAGDGAMVWRDDARRDRRVQHGAPLGRRGMDGPARRAARVPGQRARQGDRRARASSGSSEHGAKVIGLETMPRTMDNIGFYSALGFVPGRLTITLTLEAARRRRAGAAARPALRRATGRTRSPSAGR